MDMEVIFREAVQLREELHRIPETSGQEFKTCEIIRRELAKIPGVRVLPPFLETDTVAVIDGAAPGKNVTLRADIDALDTSVKDYEPLMALDGGTDGLDFYRAISEKWRDALAKNGRLYFEVGIGQADDVVRIMRNAGFGNIEIVKDTLGINRVVYGTVCEGLE